jgi:hypothetical protein
VKDKRPGESLWISWDGEGYEPYLQSPTIFYTVGHVDKDNDIVRRALASSLQRDGCADSLSDGYNCVDSSHWSWGWMGYVDESIEPYICSELGETFYGDFVDDEPEPITLIEF